MKPQARSFNPKRRLARGISTDTLQHLAERVRYTGSPYHKRNPGDFGLTPPARPRPDKTLCDGINLYRKAEVQALLISGIQRGLVSEQTRGGFPQNVWSLSEEGIPVEAELDDQVQGTYHGYPMTERDPMADLITKEWERHE